VSKKPEKRSFLYHSAVYWTGKMLARSISIILLPIYTAYLVPAEYGILSIFGIIIDVFMLVFSLQLPTAIYRYWAKAESEKERQLIIGTSFLVTIFVAFFLMLPIYFWAAPIACFLDIEPYTNLLRLVLFEIQIALILSIFYVDMRIRDESKLYSALEIIASLAIGVLSVFFVVYMSWGVAGMISAQVLIFLFIAVCCAPRFFRRLTLRIDLSLIRKMIGFALPLIPAAVAMAAVHTSDRLFIQKMLGAADTGIYAIGYKFGMLVSILVVGPFLLIWEPKSFEIAREENAVERYAEVFTYLTVTVSFVAVALTGLSREIVMIMVDEKYWNAYRVIPWVAWSYVFFAMSMVARVGLLVEKKTMVSAWIVLLIFFINITGNFLLISRLGILGAAISTLFSFVMYFIVNLLYSYEYIPIKFELKKLVYLFVIIIFFSIIMNSIHIDNAYLSISLKLLVLSFMPGILFFLGFFTQLELGQRIRSYIPNLSKTK